MGMTHAIVTVAKPGDRSRSASIKFLVDSGALYSVVPAEVLDRLGIPSETTQRFMMANGQTYQRRKGVATYVYGDRVGGADVVFGEAEDVTLLGSTALEALGLGLDPIRREFIPLPMIMAGQSDA